MLILGRGNGTAKSEESSMREVCYGLQSRVQQATKCTAATEPHKSRLGGGAGRRGHNRQGPCAGRRTQRTARTGQQAAVGRQGSKAAAHVRQAACNKCDDGRQKHGKQAEAERCVQPRATDQELAHSGMQQWPAPEGSTGKPQGEIT